MTSAKLDGKTLNHYEVREKIGAGGMGEVYRAFDTTLERDVAIKIIAAEFDPRSDAFARFGREARILASLNHANIAAIHGFEECEGTPFLVLEYVPGEDLSMRLKRGALPIVEALAVAHGVATALEASHARDVIHRDLKPGNVKLMPDGQPKVLDFGLAKGFTRRPLPEESTMIGSDESRTRGILGTGPYMSPEQARGHPLDKRTDIWSFGCLLFEMLTARAAFAGETLSDNVARILKGDPEWDRLPVESPPAVRRLLRRCLRKDIEHRLHDIGDARIEIEEALNDLESQPVAPAAEHTAATVPARRTSRVRIVIGALLLVAAFAGGWWLRSRRPAATGTAPGLVTRFVVDEPLPYWRPSPGQYPLLATSPDGEKLVYLGTTGSVWQLFMRRTSSMESVPLPGTDGAAGPFFSPDGAWLGYFRRGELYKVSLNGGTPMHLGPAGLPRGASWGPDGSIIYAPLPESGLIRLPAGGGAWEVLTRPDRAAGERTHRWPHILPSGKAVLFTVGLSRTETFDGARIDALDLRNGRRSTVIEQGTFPFYSPSGHLLYLHSGTLMAAPFDARRLETTGDVVDVVHGLEYHPFAGSAQLTFSHQGTLAYLPGGRRVPQRTIVQFDANGTETPVDANVRAFNTVSLSPDGRRLATDIDGACSQIFIHDLERGGAPTRLTLEFSNTNPIWTPDGSKVTFASDRHGLGNIYWKDALGDRAPERLTSSENKQWPGSWSPDGKTLIYVEQSLLNTDSDLWTIELGGDRPPRPFVDTPYVEEDPEFSPDGAWVAYVSSESIGRDVYVKPFPEDGRKWKVSASGGIAPKWSKDGRKLYFLSDFGLHEIDIGPGPEFSPPRRLFDVGQIAQSYDTTSDGRIIAVKVADEERRAGIQVVVNWVEELKRRVPVP